jgi:hypothetical protein
LNGVVRSRPQDPFDNLRKICDAFDAAPTVSRAVRAARKRAREIQAERRAKQPRRKPR